jgi:hypothetical protein
MKKIKIAILLNSLYSYKMGMGIYDLTSAFFSCIYSCRTHLLSINYMSKTMPGTWVSGVKKTSKRKIQLIGKSSVRSVQKIASQFVL